MSTSKNAFGPASPLIHLDAFLARCKQLNDEDDQAITIDTGSIHPQVQSMRNTITNITTEDERLLNDADFVQRLKTHSDRHKSRRKQPAEVTIDGITNAPQQCFQDCAALAYHIRQTDADDINGVASSGDINARGKGWDYRCGVVEIDVRGGASGSLDRQCIVALSTDAPLSALIDRIKCATHISQSGCIVFDGTPCYDRRYHGCEKYESAIRANFPLKQGAKSESVENVKITDIPLRTGSFGWYVHNGNCEHTMQITSVRLKATKEVLPRYKFTRASCTPRPVCHVCAKKQAQLSTYRDRVGAARSLFWCRTCFDNLHNGFDVERLEVYEIV